MKRTKFVRVLGEARSRAWQLRRAGLNGDKYGVVLHHQKLEIALFELHGDTSVGIEALMAALDLMGEGGA